MAVLRRLEPGTIFNNFHILILVGIAFAMLYSKLPPKRFLVR